MPDTGDKVPFEVLRRNWVFIVAFFFMSVAWGQSQFKIQTIEEAVKNTSVVQEKVVDLKIQNARIEEQLKIVKESQKTQEELLRSISRDLSIAASKKSGR